MPALYKAEGIILRTRPLGESDRIITLLSPDIGRVHAVARGSRKIKSIFMGKLEPATKIKALIAYGRNLDIITQVQVIEFHPYLRRNLQRLVTSAYLLELFEAFSQSQEKSTPQYNLLEKGLLALEKGIKPEVVCRACEIKLIWFSGYQPELDVCVVCRKKVESAEHFSSRLGGIICDRCSGREKNLLPFPEKTRVLYRKFLKSPPGTIKGEEIDRQTADNLELIMADYLAGIIGRPFSSSRFIKEFRGEQ
ncbi:MAG: DNA repair protein RecO [Candidatus Eremiobacteraeota bacterium]|nr:DNA repair protein RecO [Candidatus Eremiobacteraeota bacterium]